MMARVTKVREKVRARAETRERAKANGILRARVRARPAAERGGGLLAC